MNNVLEIDGHKAVVTFDPDIEMFRGEFLGLSGGADFYGASVGELVAEAKKSLEVYLKVCQEKSIEPYRKFSGKFNLRLSPDTHEAIVTSAAAQQKSLNEWVVEVIEEALQETGINRDIPSN